MLAELALIALRYLHSISPWAASTSPALSRLSSRPWPVAGRLAFDRMVSSHEAPFGWPWCQCLCQM